MSEIILYIHVISGTFAIVSSISPLSRHTEKLKSAFWPSISAVSISGIGLMFSGASIIRVCVSGMILVASLILIRQYTFKKLAKQ